ncbi:MAG: hypothetical protein ACXWCU_11475 [Caldimonas sp.]
MRSIALPLVAAFLVSACSSVPPPAPSVPPTLDQRAAAPGALAVERQWLGSWFQGTPVLIKERNDGAVTVDVPREFCFEPGRSAVRPALAAVLNKVAESLRRLPLARVPLLAAPNDAPAASPLALQRAHQVQEYLVSRGVPAARLGKPSATGAAAVQLRIEAAPL